VVPRGAPQPEVVAKAMAEEGVKRFVEGNAIRKVVFVPDRLVNFVV